MSIIKENNKSSFNLTGVFIFLLSIVIVFVFYSIGSKEVKYVSFQEFKNYVTESSVSNVAVESDGVTILATLKDGSLIKTNNPNTEESNNFIYNSGLVVNQSKISTENKSIVSSISSVLMMVLVGIILFSLVKGSSSKSMFEGGIDTESKTTNLTFDDVAGAEETKESLSEISEYLKNPSKFKKYGVKSPSGCLLYGPPGTGKTLLAKALAGESGCSFISVAGSNFVDKFVGNGASRVRHLFAEAKNKKPCIIFIDEIDAIGGKRNSVGGNEERNQTLNELLSCMQGFDEEDGIVVIGATNRLDSLDTALIRSGRFDTKVYIGLPDLKARKRIFEIHSKNKPIRDDVDFNALAKMTTYFSGSDIDNVMNKAGFYAAREDKEFIDMNDIDKAINHLIAGEEKKDRTGISPADKELTAYHEAGHAIIAKLKAKCNVPKISIIPTTHGAGGYTLIDNGEKSYKTKNDLENQIAIALGGRAAEELIYGKEFVTTGASNDIQKVTEIAHAIITQYGMTDSYGTLYLAETANIESQIIKECKKLVDSIYKESFEFLKENKDILEKLSNLLIEQEVVLETEFDELLKQ